MIMMLCLWVMWESVGIFCIFMVSEFGDLVNRILVLGWINLWIFLLSIGL